jgi:hypothetical protein
MLHGTLLQQEDKWIVVMPSLDDFVSYLNEFPVHPEHNLWVKIHGQDGMRVSFKIKDEYANLISKLP